jgi:hypothetical protein
MKKLLFYISLVLSILLLFNIIAILATDFNRLTEYGYGYLVGKIILFLLFGVIVVVTRKYRTKPKQTL